MGSFCKIGSLFLQKMGSILTIGSFLYFSDDKSKLTDKLEFNEKLHLLKRLHQR